MAELNRSGGTSGWKKIEQTAEYKTSRGWVQDSLLAGFLPKKIKKNTITAIAAAVAAKGR